MAEDVVRLDCIASAMTSYKHPTTVYNNQTLIELYASGDVRQAYFRFNPPPDSIKRRVLLRSYLVTSLSMSMGSTSRFTVMLSYTPVFDENTLTYNTSPSNTKLGTTSFTAAVTEAQFPDVAISPFRTVSACRTMCFMVKDDSGQDPASFGIYTQLAASGLRPQYVIEYDNAVNVNYVITGTSNTSGYVNPAAYQSFTWSIDKDDTEYCLAAPVQASAVFHWRAGTSGAYNDVPVSGSARTVTIAPGTFPVTDTLQWYVTVVDDLGVSRNSPVYSPTTSPGNLIAAPSAPTTFAFVDRSQSASFQWTNTNAYNVLTQTGADLQWRESSSGTWQTLGTVSGADTFYRVPAGTFPSMYGMQWRVRSYNAAGVAGPWSAAAYFTTIDAVMYAEAVSPSGVVADRKTEIMFTWSWRSTSGTLPTASDVQWSSDGATWTDLGTTSGPTLLVAPAGTFPAGTIYWRVRNYNTNDVAGPWSTIARFIAYGAPDAPSVTVEAVPFATIRWQGDGQQAYRITVDGRVYGPFFGTAKSCTLEDYLEDGSHTAAVEMQGAYGLWSQPGEAQFEIQNVPGEPITLRGRMHIDAQLDWTGDSDAAEFLIYRDGRRIGRTRGAAFLDRLTLGTHSWQVIGRLADGNYTPSNVITGTLASCPPRIAPASGGDWLALTMSENSSRAIETAESRPVSLRHFEGAEYPVAETAPYRDASIPFDVAWTYGQTDEARRFEAMLAQPVILKTGDGCVVGILSAYVRRSVRFYRSYSCTLQRIHWEDYVDDTDD